VIEIDGCPLSLESVKTVLPTNIEVDEDGDLVRYAGSLVILTNGDKVKLRKKPDEVWDALLKEQGTDSKEIQLKRIASALELLTEQMGQLLQVIEHGTVNVCQRG
jgi:hypothetical protein